VKSLNFEVAEEDTIVRKHGESEMDGMGDAKVQIRHEYAGAKVIEGKLGDSGCFGTRTMRIGDDCVWKLHGGV
jgi:hypothetical protein